MLWLCEVVVDDKDGDVLDFDGVVDIEVEVEVLVVF